MRITTASCAIVVVATVAAAEPCSDDVDLRGTYELHDDVVHDRSRVRVEQQGDRAFRLTRVSWRRERPVFWIAEDVVQNPCDMLQAYYRPRLAWLSRLASTLLLAGEGNEVRAEYEFAADGRITESLPDLPARAAGKRARTPYPIVSPKRVAMDIDFDDWTVWTGDGETRGLERLGLPLELRFFAGPYLEISADGDEVRLKPHYELSAYDEFRVDAARRVHANGLGGLFPFTLGDQEVLLEGLLDVLEGAALKARESDPGLARDVEEMRKMIARGAEH